jgi:hypothetical protein
MSSNNLETAVAVLAEQIKADRDEREAFRSHLDQVLVEIRSQTQRTNGRVTRLEQWMWAVGGGFAALAAPWAAKVASVLAGAN